MLSADNDRNPDRNPERNPDKNSDRNSNRNQLFYNINGGSSDFQVISFPYVGGYANSYQNLAKEFDHDVEFWVANPPGHGGSKLPLAENIDDVVQQYADCAARIIKPDCVFFGHSMGAVVAYCLANYFQTRKEDAIQPKALVISASGTPGSWNSSYSKLSDDALVELMISFGAVAEELINEHDFLLSLAPVFRSDYRILESAAEKKLAPISIPVFLLWGQNDKAVTLQDLLKWAECFTCNPMMWMIKNVSHMFVHTNADEVGRCIKYALNIPS